MNFSFEDALLGDEELEQYQDFTYDITDIASFKGRSITKGQNEQEIKNEVINIQNGAISKPQNALAWGKKEKNEFIARMKVKKLNQNNKMVYGKPIEPDKLCKNEPVLNEKCMTKLYGPGPTKAPLTILYGPETFLPPRYGTGSIFEQSIPSIKGMYGPRRCM